MSKIEDFTDSEWEYILGRLTIYTSRLFDKNGWSGKNPSFRGKSPEDIAQDAILDVIDGSRPYNENKGLDFLVFLKGIVRSEINHLATSAGATKERYFFVSEKDGTLFEEFLIIGDEQDPSIICVNREVVERLKIRFKIEATSDPLVLKILECLDSEITKPQDIAIVLGVPVTEIYNIKKRFRTTISRMKDIKKEYCL